ncbi:Ragulator complex protein LAMTOR1 [Holothuria leucospilota]|uniref:Ragulator complex protein LAMTOR1 n=1 Tax=Holothuria leucospilota TaxID=206669 RepID=A0A9Q1GZY7_HOLLE|nr:Ragulator complex protein LAMTOR1 [Holothuria leucospilota]
MGGCCGKDNDKPSVEPESSETSRLLGPQNGRTPDKPMYGDGGERHPNLLKRGDEQSALDQILHNTANNIIDVAALDSRRMEQQEYLDRARQYGSRVSNLVPNASRLQSHMLQLHNGTSMPYSVLSAEPISLHDINLINHTAEKFWNACEGIKVNHKEDLVVNFEIPEN